MLSKRMRQKFGVGAAKHYDDVYAELVYMGGSVLPDGVEMSERQMEIMFHNAAFVAASRYKAQMRKLQEMVK